MIKRHTLLRICVPDIITVEILGPAPPERVNTFSPTRARLNAKSYNNEKIEISQDSYAISIKSQSSCEPFLFEESTYEFIIEILNRDAQSKLFSMLIRGTKPIDSIRRIGNTHAYTSQINFGSQIGFVDFNFLSGKDKILFLGLEVFPSKLDYRQDFFQIREDLENEVRDLAFAVNRKTFHRAQRRRDVQAKEVEWLENLRQLFSEISKAFHRIEQAPRYTIFRDEFVTLANRPTCSGASVRRYIRAHAADCGPASKGHFKAHGKSWRIRKLPRERKSLTYDTVENRYIKWALFMLLRLVRKSIKKLSAKDMTEWNLFLEKCEQRLRLNLDAAFLKECNGQLLAPPQSLTLQMAPGYREFFSTFLDILSGLKISGGPFELSEKNLATLYEMWCFIKLGNILIKDMGINAVPDWLKVSRKGIGVTLEKGKTSVITLKSIKGEKIYLRYNPTERTPIGDRLPDNVLEIQKQGSSSGFHYIFDAKYRLCDDADYVKRHHAPGPPEDTINKMHAYRDQIVTERNFHTFQPGQNSLFWDNGNRQFIQKNIAAFVLYPYSREDYVDNRFFQSIEKVGVGGLPFLPGNTQDVSRLLKKIVSASNETEEDRFIAPCSADERKRIAWSHQYGLMGIVRHQDQLDYILKHQIYHMPYTRFRGARLRADFILLFQSKAKFGKQAGVNYQAKVKSFHVGNRDEMPSRPPWPGRKEGLYAWFKLGKVEMLSRPLPPTDKGYPAYFRVTTRLALEQANSIEELSLIREPERRLYQELRRAGFDVKVREHSRSQTPTYDISDLRLILSVYSVRNYCAKLTFDPKHSAFLSEGKKLFSFEDLMCSPDECLKKMKRAFVR